MSLAKEHLFRRLLEALRAALSEDRLPTSIEDRQDALLAVADLEHRLGKSGKCETCGAPVRSIMSVVATDDAGNTFAYDCLCGRCREAEKAYSRRVTAYIAGLVYEDFTNAKELVPRPSRRMQNAA